ncbi:MAG TPA: hypothetical protein VHC47_14735 [Mucilaginibacter sp.]|nr:hypothetical protein [Mucilaginibacter sp.]
MKPEREEKLDDLFRKGLGSPPDQPAYSEADWDAMERMLDKRKKRSAMIYWLPVATSAAAILLIFMGWWMMRKPVKPAVNGNTLTANPRVSKHQEEKHPGTSGGTIRQVTDGSEKKISPPVNYAAIPARSGDTKKTDRSLPYLPVGAAAKLPAGGKENMIAQTGNPVASGKKDIGTADGTTSQPGNDNGVSTKKDLGSADVTKTNSAAAVAQVNPGDKHSGTADKKNPGTADESQTNSGSEIAQVKPNDKHPGSSDKKDLGTADNTRPNRAVLAISAIASSDMNGVNSFGGKLGGNFGGMVSVTFARKWTISTGAMYSIKPYSTPFSAYHTTHQFSVNPSSVDANCRMIDIPLNINYQVYSKGANRFTVGTGLSSYLIMREDYHFNYSSNSNYNYNTGPSGYSIINKNHNVLSIMNLDATFEHRISSRMGIMVQPYVKVPLSNVGESQAKLQSTGVAVGLSWDINALRKPK